MHDPHKVNWNDIPFPPRKCPFFYGWAILALGALGFLMSAPGQTMGVAPFTDALIAHLGLSRQQLSLAYMLGTIASALLLTRAGMLYDRLGARIVGTVACVGLGSVLLILSRVDRIAASLGGAASAAMCVMVVGFFLLRFFVFGLYFTAIAFHVVSIFEEGGMTRPQAFAIFFPASVVSVLVRLAAGWASDHTDLKRLLLVMLAGMAVSMAGAMTLAPGAAVTALIVGNGIAGGLVGLLMGITWPRYYGSAHLGAISGFCMSMTVFGSAVGPWLFGQALARTRSYDAGVALCLAATLVLLVAALFAGGPQGREGSIPTN